MPRRAVLSLALCAALAVLAGCAAVDAAVDAATARRTPRPGQVTSRVSPLHDARGLHPGLTIVPPGERAAARAFIARVLTRGRGPRTGYARERFGPAWTDGADTTWGHDGCRTREQVLRRDLTAVTLRPGTAGCVVLTGLLREPYTGRLVEFSKSRPEEVQIDHVVPLSYAWQLGAARWTRAKRLRIANDPLNLLAADGAANRQKSGSGPASWLPRRRAIRCAYAVRIAQVARAYDLPVTPPDRAAMLGQCA